MSVEPLFFLLITLLAYEHCCYLPEYNFMMDLTIADEKDIQGISRHLGQDSLNIMTLFRRGKKKSRARCDL